MRPGPLIAIDVVSLYTLLSPMVLFGIYVFFDWISQGSPNNALLNGSSRTNLSRETSEKDPGLWNREEILAYLNRN